MIFSRRSQCRGFKFPRVGERWLLTIILVLHIVVAAVAISYQDVTIDERGYYIYGIRWLHGQVDRVDLMDDSKSPFTVLSAIPRSVIQFFNPNYAAHDNGRNDLLMGRHLMVVYTIIIALYFFVWCRRAFGCWSWVLPLLFFLFDPLVLSYSMLVISDMATGACMIAVFYHLWQFFENRRLRHYVYMSLAVGLSCVAKPSLLFLLPCLFMLWLILLATRVISFSVKRAILHGGITVASVLLMINALYFFKETFVLQGSLETHSQAFNGIVSRFPLLSKLPVPVPKSYYQSLDMLQLHKETGGGTENSTYPGVFLNGETRLKSGFWNYYLLVGWYKTPLATLLLMGCSLVTGLVSFNAGSFLRKHIFYVWPCLFFLLVLSLVNTFQIGLRHILMIYPLLFIGIAAALSFWKQRSRFAMPIATAGFAWLAVSVAVYYPDLIPYSNEMVTDKKMIYTHINDSSIDYGQAWKYIPAYIQTHPGVELPPSEPRPGDYIVPMLHLLPYIPPLPNKLVWLKHFKPVAHYKYSLLIYHITETDLQNAGLK